MKKFLSSTVSCTPVFALLSVFVWPKDVSAEIAYKLFNPMSDIPSIEILMGTLLEIFIMVAIPIVILFIIIGGFQYATAKGNAEKTQKATQTLTYAIIGGLLIIGAVTIGQIITDLVTAFRT